MQEAQDLVPHPCTHGAGFCLCEAVRPLQHRLCEFEVPVAENIPDKPIGCPGSLVESIALDTLGDFTQCSSSLVCDPAIDGLLRRLGSKSRYSHAFVQSGKAARIPQLGCKITIAFDPLCGELDVAALRRHGGEREAQRVGPELIDQVQR